MIRANLNCHCQEVNRHEAIGSRHEVKHAARHSTYVGALQTTARVVLSSAAIALAAANLAVSPVNAQEMTTPQLFENKCAGCHMNGGNVVQPGATLFPEDLQRNKVDSSEALYRLIYSGKGKMPGYGIDCAPKGKCTFASRLPDEQVQELTDYVMKRAGEGWK